MSEKRDKAQRPQTPPIVSVLSGGVAGGFEAAATYPFEFAKTRVQLHNENGAKPPRNPFRIVFQVYEKEGFRSLYKGCSALIVGSIGKDAVRFLSFDTVKNAFKDPETGTLSPARNMLAGMSAGVVASIFAVTPTERIKTALIDDARSARRYRSTVNAILIILREDGFVGLYRGFAGTTLKQASATSFRMGSYNIIKDFEQKRNIPQNTAINFVNGAVAGIITTLATQPFDTIKTRSQSAKATTTMGAVASIMKDGGVRSFWRGTIMRLGRTVFSGGKSIISIELPSPCLRFLRNTFHNCRSRSKDVESNLREVNLYIIRYCGRRESNT
jgi:solute carrier family 25 (mitochondrial citrate transporter), member 1